MASKSNLRWKSLTKKFWQNRIHTYFKVRKFQNENIKCRIIQNMNQKIWYNSALNFTAEFFQNIVGNEMSSYFHSEMSWPLAEIENLKIFAEYRSNTTLGKEVRTKLETLRQTFQEEIRPVWKKEFISLYCFLPWYVNYLFRSLIWKNEREKTFGVSN